MVKHGSPEAGLERNMMHRTIYDHNKLKHLRVSIVVHCSNND